MTIRPLLLDLFCGAGGAAMGYHRAGFDVIGVDINPQPNYPFTFIQDDAPGFLRRIGGRAEYAAIHASPPCHDHSKLRITQRKTYGTGHLLGATLELLAAQPLPFVVENVDSRSVRTEMVKHTQSYITLCGSMFGLEVHRDGVTLQIRRHRLFAGTVPILVPGCAHRGLNLDVTGHNMQGREYRSRRALGLPFDTLADRRAGMGIDWTSRDELSESIPPAFTEYLGAQLIDAIEVAAA